MLAAPLRGASTSVEQGGTSGESSVQSARALARADWGIAALVALALLAMGAWRMVPGVTGVYHDDAIYVITAKSLAEGQGYHLIDLPGAPRQTKYPILYPLLLAGVWKLWPEFPQNVVLMQSVTLLLAAAAVGLACAYLLRFGYVGRAAALAIGLISATSPTLTYFSTLTMSEMPFALLAVIALWRLERALAAPATRTAAVLTGAVLALPVLCRSIGVAFVAAGLVQLAWRRRLPVHAAAGSSALVAPWLLWSAPAWGLFASHPATGYYVDYGGEWSSVAAHHLLGVVLLNLLHLASGARCCSAR